MHVDVLTYDDLLNNGKQAADDNNYSAATESYEKAINLEPSKPLAYNRLMIVYRKQKMYQEELQLINNAIKNILAAYNSKKPKFRSSSNISKLSNALMKSAGLADKKGNLIYEPEQVSTWKKRKQTVLKRLGKKS